MALEYADGGLADRESSIRDEIHRVYERLRDSIPNFIPKEAPVQVDAPTASKVYTGLKLPKFSIPTFDGNTMIWSNFWYQFSVAIHDKTELSDTTKLSYLRDVLKVGPAEAVIRGFAKTGDNYDEVVHCLQNRYGDFNCPDINWEMPSDSSNFSSLLCDLVFDFLKLWTAQHISRGTS